MTTTQRGVGARSVTGKRKHGLRWLPWAALLLLLALIALVVLVVTNVNDQNDNPGLDVTDDEVSNDSAPAISNGSDLAIDDVVVVIQSETTL